MTTDDVLDTQIIAENVSFLDNFDVSFNLQSSLLTIREYSQVDTARKKSVKWNADETFLKNNTISNNTLDKELFSQHLKNQNQASKKLSEWGLPRGITDKYEQKGIKEMFEWQIDCLSNSKVFLDYKNLIYSAPTSAGKSLVAEILTIKTVLERQKKVIMILPYVSIVREKMFYLQDILSPSGLKVEGFMGSHSPPGGLQAVHIAICTIEKANSIINRLLDENNITELGAVIVDELHLLGDPHRGYLLELLLTKIKYVSDTSDNIHIQIIGMSATLPNLDDLANWLTAELFITNYRPIPLDEYCLVGNKYFDSHGDHVRNIEDVNLLGLAGDNVLKICLDTIKDGYSILIFCMTKKWCESLAQNISSSIYKLGCSESIMSSALREQLKSVSIMEVLEQLNNCPVGLDKVLKNTISFGVAYHHAGLTFDERDIIEGGFKSGAIRVLVATSTLSSGVNLPARKVIIRSPVFQKQPINILTYKQMIGRAGRMGKDTKGDSILVCTETEKKIGFNLMMGTLDSIKSCINTEDKYMRAILEMIASQVACTTEELNLYSKCTLLFTQQKLSLSQNFLLSKTIEELKNYELVRSQICNGEERYIATPLGKACLSSSMAPYDGMSLFCELQKARQCLVLETDLHLIYLVTPYSVSSQWVDIDWLHLLTMWESLTKAMKRVGDLIGVQESFIICCLRGTNKNKHCVNKLNIHKRFYTALALQDLVNEIPLSDVANKFQCARGFLQSLQQSAATFAGMVTSFCHQLGWKNMEILVSQFQDRLHFGIHSELIELMKLPSLNGNRARALYDAGYETVASIAAADENLIENALHKAVPFQSEKERDDDDRGDIRKRNKLKIVWITGRCGMTVREAAANLILEARKYLENEIGVTEIKWTEPKCNILSNIICEKKGETLQESYIMSSPKTHKDLDGIKSPCPTKQDQILHVSNCVKKITNVSEDSVSLNNKHNGIEKAENVENTETRKETQNCALPKNLTLLTNTSKSDTLSSYIACENWDTMNVTPGLVNKNASKECNSESFFSPDISIIEIKEESSENKFLTNISRKNISKDISLFSSDGDNSSLFEESFPVDLITTKYLDSKFSKTNCNVRESPKLETFLNYGDILKSNTILNEFESTISNNDQDDEIKLVYEEDVEDIVPREKLDMSDDIEVISTLEVKPVKSPFKRVASDSLHSNKNGEPRTKKIKTESFGSPGACLHLNPIKFNFKLSCVGSCSFSLEINKVKIKCYVLSGNDILDQWDKIESLSEISIYLDIENSSLTTSDIGRKVFKISDPTQYIIDKGNKDYSIINGIAIYSYCRNICIYINISTLENRLLLQSKISRFLCCENRKMKLIFYKLNCFHFRKSFEFTLPLNYIDIALIEWLINSDEIPQLTGMVKKYCHIDLSTFPIKIDNKEKKLRDLKAIEKVCLKSWAVWVVAEKQERNLLQLYQNVFNIVKTEIQISRILSLSEYAGLTVNKDLASRLLVDINKSQDILQKKAYKICGHTFNINSSKDVAKVLGMYKGKSVSTRKSVLASHNTPLSRLIIYWRKLNAILSKTLYPLTEKACIYSKGNRIHPSYTVYTCTGRISMHEPNLQNVPRTFSVPAKYLTLDEGSCTSDDVIDFNCREIFEAPPGYVLISADYCQLEMRILTHYSEDKVLLDIMKSDMDVFKAIAASWGVVPLDQVDDDLRQKAKQLCYGIIYGMGNKTLSQQLEVTELEAAVFMDTFHSTYPAIKSFTQSVIQECRSRGYVETLMKRRRYLPDINSNIASKKSTAERQAVNTTIQGSAADIVKAVMCAIEDEIKDAQLILQMHDELIYEVPESSERAFVTSLKRIMENTVHLKVPLPVKVRSGYTWGSMTEITV